MRFHLTGVLKESNRAESLTWENGQVKGPSDLIQEVLALARLYEGRELGPVEGPYTYSEHLRDPNSAALLMGMPFKPWTIIMGGDVLERPEIPKDAVG